jgi:hypothetical protein
VELDLQDVSNETFLYFLVVFDCREMSPVRIGLFTALMKSFDLMGTLVLGIKWGLAELVITMVEVPSLGSPRERSDVQQVLHSIIETLLNLHL